MTRRNAAAGRESFKGRRTRDQLVDRAGVFLRRSWEMQVSTWGTRGGSLSIGRAASLLAAATMFAGAAQGGVGDFTLPEWTAPIIEDRYDAAYQDMRTSEFVFGEVAKVYADKRYLPFTEITTPDVGMAPQFCFAPGVAPTPEMQEWINQQIFGAFEDRFFLEGSSWSTARNTPTTLSWSFVPDGVVITNNQGQPIGVSSLFAAMDAHFAQEGGRDVWIAQFQWAFDRWAALSGLSYQRVTFAGQPWDDAAAWGTVGNDTTRGDVRICGIDIDGPFGILAFNPFPAGGSDMHMDVAERWDDNSPPDFTLLRSTVAHEHGHGMGLMHVCPVAGVFLMEPAANENFEGPQHDDIRGAQRLYGDAFEPNGTSATATNVGTIVAGGTLSLGALPTNNESVPATSLASIVDRQGTPDRDFYRVQTDGPILLNVSLQPIGTVYESAEQESCNGPFNVINTIAIADLKLQVLGSNGTTIVLDRDQSPIGSIEFYNGLLLPAGTFFVAAQSDNGQTVDLNAVQMYNLSVVGRTDPMLPTASDSTVDGGIEITWPSIPNAVAYRLRRNTVNSITGATTLTLQNPLQLGAFDTGVTPQVQYFYWLEVQQFNNGPWTATAAATSGEPGMRPPNNVPPVANAGPDQIVFDTPLNGFGFEPVVLNGTASTDSDGTINQFQWRRNGLVVLQQATGTVILPVGTSTIDLTVTDDDFAQASDSVVVQVRTRQCDSVDFNNDGSVFDPTDVDAFLSVFSEGPCIPAGATCNDLDFNNDGSIFDPGDIDVFLSVFSEWPCF
jgi:hypothetical protein